MNPLFKALVASVCLVIWTSNAEAEKLSLSVSAEAAILINADTGAILYEKNAHAQFYPASITKIATAIYALENAADKMDVEIAADQECIGTVTEEALRRSNYTLPAYLLIPDGSHIGIKKGEVLSLCDLMHGLMLASGDDAANVIAKFVGGSIPDFMEGMNAYLQKLGCTKTSFQNPHGLHHPKHLTTAYDMAILTQHALKNPIFCQLVSTVRYTRPKTNKQEPSVMMQTNRLIRSGPYHYPKAIGVKTGYYSLAGSTLVAAAKDGDRTLIAVLLKVQERKDMFIDAKKMFEMAFNQPKVQRMLVRQGPQKYSLAIPGAVGALNTYTNENLAIEYYPAEEPKFKCLLYWKNDLQLPILKGQQVGELVVELQNGQMFKKAALYAQEEVKPTWMFRIKNFFNSGFLSVLGKILGVILVVVVLGILFIKFRNRH